MADVMDWITAYSYFRMAAPAGWRIRIEQGELTYVVAYETRTNVKVGLRLPGETLDRGDVAGVKILARRLQREIYAWGHVPPMVEWWA